MVACVTHFDTDLSGAAEQLRAAGSAGDFKQAQQQIASAGGRLQEMKTALQTHVLLAGLGIVFLTIVGSLFMHSGSKVLRASLTPAGEAAVPSCCAGSSGVHDQPPVPGGPPSAT
ncbi:MAG: hypothetical protein HY303_09760 [Candidatus Wallbacteria bacterium]|nr:hypothetical protein [Candidatus Wallbacteria bacterium]